MANIAVPDNPVFNTSMEETTEDTPGSCEEFNLRFASLLSNDKSLKNAISRNKAISTLAAGETSITCTIEGLDSNSSISVYADVPGLGYTGIVVDGDNVTVTFEKQEQDIQVKVVVADGMV